MREASLSSHLRGVQDDLTRINDDLDAILQIAKQRSLAPIHLSGIQNAISMNQTVWDNLNIIATRLELTGGPDL